MIGRLTTHVLDISCGKPAHGMKVELWLASSENPVLLRSVQTNQDGRIDSPLLEGDEFREGGYELIFYVADYFCTQGHERTELPFLDKVPIRFCVSDKKAHYHVPLLVAPGGYSTYRGS